MSELVADDGRDGFAEKMISTILSTGLDGLGPFKSARQIAEEHRTQHADVDVAIERIIRTHTRMVAATGFATGLGGPLTLPISIPTDVAVFYALCARCVGAVAHLR